MSGRRSRDKGARAEREVVNLHRAQGVHAERVPLSGAAGGGFFGDVHLYILGSDVAPLIGEVKARASGRGFATLESWLNENDVLFLRRDRSEPMVVLPWRSWSRLVGKLR
jgi:Holliday junction resolvase